MKLTAENVEKVFKDCLRDEPSTDSTEPTDMIMFKAYLDTTGHEEDIRTMLDQLDDSFKQTGGNGMSFLKAAYTKDGHHWGEHQNMAILFGLGIAAGLAKWTLPKDMWSSFPGGMPYVTILDRKED